MEEWSVFVFGVGECGKSIVLDLLNLKKTGKWMFCITDSAPGDIIKLMEEKSEKSRIIIGYRKSEKEEQRRNRIVVGDGKSQKVKPVYFRMVHRTARGFGGYWVAAKLNAERKIGEYYNQFSERLLAGDYSCFVTMNSGGGGTGCGAAPVFAKKIRDSISEKRESPHSLDLFLAVLVLPHEHEDWRGANAFSCLLRDRNVVDGILLVDNGHLMERGLGLKVINRRVISMWDTLTEGGESTKELEPADLIRLGCGKPDFNAGIIVPCYGEYEPQILQSGISLKGLLMRTLVEGGFADIDFTKSFRSTVIVVTLPEMSKDDLTTIQGELEEYIKDFFPWKEETSVVCKRKGEKIRVVILVADPYIPRLEELYIHFVNHVSDEEKLKEYISKFGGNPEQDLKEFREIIKSAKKSMDEGVFVFDKWLIENLRIAW